MPVENRIVTVHRQVAAPVATLFELIADPSQQPRWDGNANLVEAAADQRVHAVGDVFSMTIHTGAVRENHVTEFEEARRIGWRPAPVGEEPPGHTWVWELLPLGNGDTLVRHTYDWTGLSDESRFDRARANTPDALLASVDRLAALAEA